MCSIPSAESYFNLDQVSNASSREIFVIILGEYDPFTYRVSDIRV